MTDLGAPDLTDTIWLDGGSKSEIVAQIHDPQHGDMPAWKGRLDAPTIKSLPHYVHSFGGGE